MTRTEPNGRLTGHPLAPYLEGEMVDYYGDTRYTGEYPDVHVRFSMDVRGAGNTITIKGHDLTSFYVELAKDDLQEWIDSRQEMARQALEQAKKLGYGPEEPYFFTKPGEFVYDSAIRWDLGKDRYVLLRPDTSDGWLLESCINITPYVADAFYGYDTTDGKYDVRYPHKHGVAHHEINGHVYIDIEDPYGNGAKMLQETEQFIQDYNILPERLDNLTVEDIQAKYPDLFDDGSTPEGELVYDVATQDHYLKVTAAQSLPIDVYASRTGGQDMMLHTVDLNHISVENDRHAAALNHQLESMGLNGVLYSDQPGFYVVNHCSVRGPIPETPEGRQELVDSLQKAHGLVVDYDQTSHQLSTKLNLDDLVLLTDQSVYFQ